MRRSVEEDLFVESVEVGTTLPFQGSLLQLATVRSHNSGGWQRTLRTVPDVLGGIDKIIPLIQGVSLAGERDGVVKSQPRSAAIRACQGEKKHIVICQFGSEVSC
jgi:hypothetical protein